MNHSDYYLQILENSYSRLMKDEGRAPASRLDYLGDYIFNFTTYDSEMSALFAEKAIEVAMAITDGLTFDHIQDKECHKWFLIMCNIPFFFERIDYGTSIRGSWWNYGEMTLHSCGIWIDGEQCTEMTFTVDDETDEMEWKEFIRAIAQFAKQP